MENKKGKITIEMIESSYVLGKLVYEGKLTQKEALKEIEVRHNNMFKLSTASFYINNFRHLVNGERYTRTMSIMGAEYYLQNIKKDFSEEVFQNAINSMQMHIEYYNSLGKAQLNKMQALLNEFK